MRLCEVCSTPLAGRRRDARCCGPVCRTVKSTRHRNELAAIGRAAVALATRRTA